MKRLLIVLASLSLLVSCNGIGSNEPRDSIMLVMDQMEAYINQGKIDSAKVIWGSLGILQDNYKYNDDSSVWKEKYNPRYDSLVDRCYRHCLGFGDQNLSNFNCYQMMEEAERYFKKGDLKKADSISNMLTYLSTLTGYCFPEELRDRSLNLMSDIRYYQNYPQEYAEAIATEKVYKVRYDIESGYVKNFTTNYGQTRPRGLGGNPLEPHIQDQVPNGKVYILDEVKFYRTPNKGILNGETIIRYRPFRDNVGIERYQEMRYTSGKQSTRIMLSSGDKFDIQLPTSSYNPVSMECTLKFVIKNEDEVW